MIFLFFAICVTKITQTWLVAACTRCLFSLLGPPGCPCVFFLFLFFPSFWTWKIQKLSDFYIFLDILFSNLLPWTRRKIDIVEMCKFWDFYQLCKNIQCIFFIFFYFIYFFEDQHRNTCRVFFSIQNILNQSFIFFKYNPVFMLNLDGKEMNSVH